MSLVLGTFKRGDTFIVNGVYKVDGIPVDVTDIIIESSLKLPCSGADTEELQVTKQDQMAQTGEFKLTQIVDDSSEWPLGTINGDITFTYTDGTRISTQDFSVPVVG